MKNCKRCQNQFIDNPKKTIFCSHSCQAKWAQTLTIGVPKPGAKKGISLNCYVCEKSFYVPRNRIKTAKYCSRSCLAKEHLKSFIAVYGFQKTGNPPHKYKYININGKQVRLHRHIMQEHLGRKLERWEHVHHINNNSEDNRLENLIVLSNSDHQKEEHKLRKTLISSSQPV